MCPKDADGIANTVDPDQTAPTLCAQTPQSKKLRIIIQYFHGNLSVVLCSVLCLIFYVVLVKSHKMLGQFQDQNNTVYNIVLYMSEIFVTGFA